MECELAMTFYEGLHLATVDGNATIIYIKTESVPALTQCGKW